MKTFAGLETLRPFMDKCSSCGLCLPACPTFAQTRLETDGPRGRLMLASGLCSGAVSPSQAVRSFATCLLCGRCERACPARIPLGRIFFAVRPVLPLQLAHNKLFRSLIVKSNIQDFLQPPLSLIFSLIRKTHSGRLTELPLQPFGQEVIQSGKSKNSVLLFAGCMTRRVFPDIGRACVAALEKQGYDVVVPPELVCCGRPLAVQGKSIISAVRRNLAVLAKHSFRWLVTPCPGCLATFRDVWPDVVGFSEKERQQIQALAAKCMDINELLALKEPEGSIGSARGIWWHRPCLMSDNANSAAKSIIAEAGEVLDVQAPVCCGAPLFCLKNSVMPASRRVRNLSDPIRRLIGRQEPALSESLAAGIRHNARKAHADCIAVGCPGCKFALKYGKTGGHELPVLHSIEIYMRKRGNKSPW